MKKIYYFMADSLEKIQSRTDGMTETLGEKWEIESVAVSSHCHVSSQSNIYFAAVIYKKKD
jgi:hypothetical protein